MFSFHVLDADAAFDPFILLILALIVDWAVGGMGPVFRLLPHPVVVIGRVIGWFDRKLNRARRSSMERAVRGLLTVICVVLIAGALGVGVQWLTLHHDFGWVVELFLLVALLAQRELYSAVARVMRALRTDGIEGGRRAVSEIVARDPAYLDEHGVSRAAIESLAENFSDGVVAPVFWYALFGFPGLLIYKAINTLDSMIGYKNDQYRAFGFAAARLDDIVNLAPARLSGLIFTLAALITPKANPARAFRTMWRDAGKHNSPNAGWPEAAMAGALGLALAGPRTYPQHTVDAPWMGDGRATATAVDVERALYLFGVACLINALIVTVIAVFRLQLGH